MTRNEVLASKNHQFLSYSDSLIGVSFIHVQYFRVMNGQNQRKMSLRASKKNKVVFMVQGLIAFTGLVTP